MMEPIDSENLSDSSVPPPVPTSPPPPENPAVSNSSLPPAKPKKSRRSVSPVKDGDIKENGGGIENGKPLHHTPPMLRKSDSSGDEGKVNGDVGMSASTGAEGNPEKESPKMNGGTKYGYGGVAKIVGEIEKNNGAPSEEANESTEAIPQQNGHHSNGALRDEQHLDEVRLRQSPNEKPTSSTINGNDLTPIEKSVLREMPVDVEIENGDQQGTTSRKAPKRESRNYDMNGRGDESNGFSSGGEDSPRKSANGVTVKRTPTMEFKKQCSKIVRIRTKVSNFSRLRLSLW